MGKYGYFDDVRREYVITDPKTPLPWINYLGSNDFFRLISNTAGGYCFYKDAKLMRLTRYRYNNSPADCGGHYFYIKDGETIWNPGWQPTQTALDSYSCRHGLGRTVFSSSKNGISARQEVFVPVSDPCEVTRLTLTNEGDTEKTLDLFSYVEFCLWNAMDDMSNFQRNLSIGEVEVSGSRIYHKTEYRERRNHYAVFAVNRDIAGYDTDRDAFIGLYNGAGAPQAVLEGKSRNSIAHGWAPVGSHHLVFTLSPGESVSTIFVLAYCENSADTKFEAPGIINKTPADTVLAKYRTDEQVNAALHALAEYWDDLLSRFRLSGSDEKLGRLVNIWNQYQCMVTFNMSRSASYYESGLGRGMGFRDSCQDLLGFVHLIPERARERILDIANTQFADGSTYHQYQPLTKRGNMDVGSGFNDDPLWLIAGTCAYIRETGDFSILNESCTFDNNEADSAPLLEHLRRSFRFTATHKGPHGLPLIGRADWNDCLNLNCFSTEPGESFQTTGPSEGPVAESVFIAGMFVKYGNEYADLLEYMSTHPGAFMSEQPDEDSPSHASGETGRASGKEPISPLAEIAALRDEAAAIRREAAALRKETSNIAASLTALREEAAAVREEAAAMEAAILDAGWDGSWFIRAYDAFSNPVGSKVCEEGKIFIEPQGMCVMAGIGKETGEAAAALKSVEEHLECEHGIMLLQPAYTVYHPELGEITSYPPGYKENAGIFCHNNPWIACAEAVLGHGSRAFEVFKKTCPVYLEGKEDIRRTEPYAYCQMVAGMDAAKPGEGKNSWLTGTAAWTFTCISQYILGIKPTLDGLQVDPCIPPDVKGFHIERKFRGALYHIDIDNSAGVEHGVVSMTVNGTAVEGNVIPDTAGSQQEYFVAVTMG